MGNFTNVGSHNVECIALVYCLKLLYPDTIHVIRGGAEAPGESTRHGSRAAIMDAYSEQTWDLLMTSFGQLPAAAIIDETVFAISGGLSPQLDTMTELHELPKLPTTDEDIMSDLMFGVFEDQEGWGLSDLGVGFSHGLDIIDTWLEVNDFRRVIATRTVVNHVGYRWEGPRRQWLEFGSTPNYMGVVGNLGAVIDLRDAESIRIRLWRGHDDDGGEDDDDLGDISDSVDTGVEDDDDSD